MDKTVTIFEFDDISAQQLPLKHIDFEHLKKFILPKNDEIKEVNEDEEEQTLRKINDASCCMTLCSKGGKEVICVKNYVGIVALPSGTIIEILPKIADQNNAEVARKLVVDMLYKSGKIAYKHFQKASLNADRNITLYEVFIQLFLEELAELYKKGLKAGYVERQENEHFLKGKIVFSEHIKLNAAHAERFFVSYDSFSFDRPENRLIKSTLLYLNSKSQDQENKRRLRQMLLNLDEITPSQNYTSDFNRCDRGRTGKDYQDILSLCKVFLSHKSFDIYSGKDNTYALLFPMNILFEKYIVYEMQQALRGSKWTLKDQDKGKYLFDDPQVFSIRPDIVLENGDKKVIIDTKWKKLEKAKQNFGISQADMYQMYAYHTRYDNIQKVILLYPYYEDITPPIYTIKKDNKNIVTIQIMLVKLDKSNNNNLFNYESNNKIIEELTIK